nr:restriction endonuclease subunit S [Sphingomonas sp. BT553]
MPNGWAAATIAEIADTKLGKMLDAAKNKGDHVPYLRNVNVRWGEFDLSDLFDMRVTPDEYNDLAVQDGDLFVCEGGEPGRSAIWCGGPQRIVFQKALHRVRTRAGIEPSYIARYLKHAADTNALSDLLTGSTIRHLPQVGLQRIQLNLPPSAEQRRIVSKLDVLTARLARARVELDRLPTLSRRSELSILRAGVTGALSEGWRANSGFESTFELLKRIPMPVQGRGGREATGKVIQGVAALAVNDPATPLPVGWAWVPLLRVAKQETGHTPSRSKPEYWDGGVPWIGIRDAGAHHGRPIAETMQTISTEGLANSSARLLPAGTVCLSRTASVGYVTMMARPMSTSQDFATWTCTEALIPEYLMYVLMAEGEDIKKFGMGSTHTTIYFPEVRAFHIALPPLNEQREIVARIKASLARANRVEAETVRARALLDRLESAILAKAFRGELVPQDPNDEPASVLLARIRVERAAAPKPKRGHRAAAGA